MLRMISNKYTLCPDKIKYILLIELGYMRELINIYFQNLKFFILKDIYRDILYIIFILR